VPDVHYTHPRLVALYDLGSGWSPDREFYLAQAGDAPISILDLGCGTGLIADACAARGHDVTGVDPAAAMLDVARRKPNGAKIDWVCATAEAFRSPKRFDLIIMTGHAFQVLLDDADIAAAFATMREHAKPNARIVFESRNPAIDWRNDWDRDLVIDRKTGATAARRFLAMDGGRMTFEWRYHFPDETLVSKSVLRFLPRAEIERRLTAAGLVVDKVLGDWDGSAFDERSSPEMIFFAKPAA
jgi:2-polyprenyl-3-methyl-5-hydroxy-6-metoxy-1,4-benzoquinol methylase